jgi:hypothetical protein
MVTDRRIHCSIDDLPGEVKHAVIEMIGRGLTYKDIAADLRRMGHSVSRSAINRWANRIRRDGGYIPTSTDTVIRARMIVRNAITVLQSLDSELSIHNRGINHE